MTLSITLLFLCQTLPIPGNMVRRIEERAFELRQARGIVAAEPVFREAVLAAESSGDIGLVSHALHYWALALRETHRFEESEQAQKRAIRMLEERLRSSKTDESLRLMTAQAMVTLVVAMLGQERVAEAEPLVRQAWIFSGKDPYTRALLLNLFAELEYRKGRDPIAEKYIQQALHAHSQIQGIQPDPEMLAHNLSLRHTYPLLLAWIHNTAGLIVYRNGRVAEAEASWRQSIRIYREVEPSGGAAIAGPLANLSELLRYRKHYHESVELATKALELYDLALGSGSLRSAFILRLLGTTLTDMGEYNQARRSLDRAFAIVSKSHGPRSPFLASVMVGLADLECKERRFAEAERIYSQAIQIIEETEGHDHPLLVSPLQGYANVLRKLKRRDEARVVDLRLRDLQIAGQAGAGSTVSLQALRTQPVR